MLKNSVANPDPKDSKYGILPDMARTFLSVLLKSKIADLAKKV